MELHQKYSVYVDSEAAFVFIPPRVYIPELVSGVDQVLLETKINDILHNEWKAVQQAVLLCSKCTEPERKCK